MSGKKAAYTAQSGRTVPEGMRSYVRQVVTDTGCDGPVLCGIADLESHWNPLAVGDSGHSIGLTQLHDGGLGAGLSIEQRQDPRINLGTAARALVANLEHFDGDMERAIASHNAGRPQVETAGDSWREIQNGLAGGVGEYVDDVLELAEEYRADVEAILASEPGELHHGMEAILIQLDSLWGTARQVDERTIPAELASRQIRACVSAIKDHLPELC